MSHLVDDCLLRNGALSCFAAHLHGVKQMVMRLIWHLRVEMAPAVLCKVMGCMNSKFLPMAEQQENKSVFFFTCFSNGLLILCLDYSLLQRPGLSKPRMVAAVSNFNPETSHQRAFFKLVCTGFHNRCTQPAQCLFRVVSWSCEPLLSSEITRKQL